MTTYKEAVELFGVARERTITAIQQIVGDRTVALNKEVNYTEVIDEGLTAINVVRQINQDGITVQDVAEGAGDETTNPWTDVPDWFILHLLMHLENGDFHDYDPDED